MARTPFMEQYLQIKAQYQDYILLFRLGDFYEMFNEDAKLVSRELGLTLTGRDCGEAQRAPMCGVPYHSVDEPIAKLIQKGYKLAICEQMEDPATAKGLVKREVVRIITPGTLTDGNLLDEKTNNYLCSLVWMQDTVAAAFVDVSTGALHAVAFDGADAVDRARNELASYQPHECLSNIFPQEMGGLASFLSERCHCMLTEFSGDHFDFSHACDTLQRQFASLPFSLTQEHAPLICAVGALIDYVAQTQKTDISYIKSICVDHVGEYLEMDVNTRRNLELTQTLHGGERRGSLLWVLDHTETSMGARTLRRWIEQPLTNSSRINRRQMAVETFVSDLMAREELSHLLKSVLDLERLATKIVYNTAGPRDLRAIAQTLRVLPQVRQYLSGFQTPALREIYENMDEHADVLHLIDDAIVDKDVPFGVRDGGFIRRGYYAQLDELLDILSDGEGWKQKIEEEEKAATGIPKLKIGYNRVFGYYIEVTNSYKDQVPDTYIRKQTLTNAERYITPELKEMESTVLGARDRRCALEYELFCEIRDYLAKRVDRIRNTAGLLGELDVYLSLARVASHNNYVCPVVDDSTTLSITEGRHPVVERFNTDHYFVPNDTQLDTDQNRLMIITGPNMAGKSTYMRQVALICLLAQIGSFVPARSAHIGVVDRLFTRVGASDDLTSGTSTFMLEMNEVSYILTHATKRSLIIYDEIGRGTSTYDGMSIARAVAEYTASDKIGAKTLFATHYHELTALEGEIPGIINYNIAAKKKGDDIIFLRRIVRGGTDDSYGIEVAKLAGVPQPVIDRAREVLAALTESEKTTIAMTGGHKTEKTVVLPSDSQSSAHDSSMSPNQFDQTLTSIGEQLRALDLTVTTPLEAMNLLFTWKKGLSDAQVPSQSESEQTNDEQE